MRWQRAGPDLVTEQEQHQQMQQTKQTENIISSQSAALSSNILRTYSFSHYKLPKTQKKLNLDSSRLLRPDTVLTRPVTVVRTLYAGDFTLVHHRSPTLFPLSCL